MALDESILFINFCSYSVSSVILKSVLRPCEYISLVFDCFKTLGSPCGTFLQSYVSVDNPILFKNFFEGIRETYKEVKSVITNTSEGDTDTSEGGTDTDTESNNNQSIYQRAEKSINQLQSFQGSLNNFTGGIKNLILGGLDTLLAGTVNKYRWDIRGSLALMTGLPTTPWHMTIGNPYQPVVSLNNIYVDNVSLTPGTEMGLGDVPTRLKVSISAKISRPLGKQEIDRIF